MPYERPEVRFEEKNVRYNSGSVYPMVALLIAIIGLGLVAAIIFLLYLVRQHLIILAWSWLLSLSALPLIGIGWLLVSLWHHIKKVQVIDIGDKGTILRSSTGNLQILGADEIFALETHNARRTINAEPEQIFPEIMSAFPEPFPPLALDPPVSTTETPVETNVETVLETLRGEQESAEAELKKKQREVIKNRISTLYNMKVSLRSIAKIVKLEGRRYNEFKALCEELGLHAD